MKNEFGSVENISHWENNDDIVVNCARISFAKDASQFTPEQNAKLIKYLFEHNHWSPFAGPRVGFNVVMDLNDWTDFFFSANLSGFSWGDVFHSSRRVTEGILNGSLWAWYQNLHLLPASVRQPIRGALCQMFPVFASVVEWGRPGSHRALVVQRENSSVNYLRFRIKCPIFVARQLVKHQVHMVWNEVSRRYVKDVPELFFPPEYHKAPEHSKQGASIELFQEPIVEILELDARVSVDRYEQAVLRGMAPEEARIFLPLCTMTEFIWTGSEAAFQRVLKQRLDSHAQGATREIAALLKQEMGL